MIFYYFGVRKSLSFEARQIWVQILALSLTRLVACSKPHLCFSLSLDTLGTKMPNSLG